jgi:serine/threonine-protein kinase
MVDDDANTLPDVRTPTVPTMLRDAEHGDGGTPSGVGERYELGGVIGRGGMGEVRVALDRNIEREVAIKRLRTATPSGDELRRFEREARIQARLDHPAIVPVHELGTDEEGRPYFTMKRLSGRTMHDRLQDAGPMQPLLRAFVDVCHAVDSAHERGIIHRDLKPANVMIGRRDEVYVLDWGVARVLGTARTSSLDITADVVADRTAAGSILGTPGYMAPEQLEGADVGPPADVYSLGAMLFEILAGEPLHAPGPQAIGSTMTRPTDSPARRRPERDLPPELDAACTAALAVDPALRPSALELARRVQAYLDGDRDLDRRRALATASLAAAQVELDSGDPERRSAAMQEAARALALDPHSVDAARLVAHLLVEPPERLPPDLEASLARSEHQLDRERSRRVSWAWSSVVLWVVMFPFVPVSSWPQAIAFIGAALAMAGLARLNWRTGKVPVHVLVGGNLVVCVLFSRLASPFVLTPMLVCVQVMALAAHTRLVTRRLAVIAFALAAIWLPIAGEWLGVLPSSYRSEPDGLLTWSTVVPNDFPALLFGQTLLAIVIAGYVVTFQRAGHDARRTAEIQAWHVRQLVPRGAARLPSAS